MNTRSHDGESKRDTVARWMQSSGITAILEALPRRPSLLVLNYHRIGNPSETPYDPGTFSGTADELYEHLCLFKRKHVLVDLDEAREIIASHKPPRRPSILVTFDDGYRDNWTQALPVLESVGAPAVFFLVTQFLDGIALPWWDAIAYVLKHSRRRTFSVSYPSHRTFDVSDNIAHTIRDVLKLYKSPAVQDGERFIQQIEEVCECRRPAADASLFLTWDEASLLAGRGVTVGSHTVSHPILAKLSVAEQTREIAESKTLLENRLGVRVQSIAYPVGSRTAFDDATKRAAREARYALGFSYYGGVNRPPSIDPFDVRRFAIDGQASHRLRFQLATHHYSDKFL